MNNDSALFYFLAYFYYIRVNGTSSFSVDIIHIALGVSIVFA